MSGFELLDALNILITDTENAVSISKFVLGPTITAHMWGGLHWCFFAVGFSIDLS